jgi:glycosyltransferase involved in cell wall biosynthesis
MRILFITQKLKQQDAFGVLWVREFIRQGFDVTVICLEGSGETFEFPVHTLGKENGASRFRSILRFEKLITTLSYDRVFIHMAPVWYTLGCWWWLLRGIPVYLWYTHYKMQLGVRLFGWFGTRFFCATAQSLPQYEGSLKKTVTGHGIDLSFWKQRPNMASDPKKLLVCHRLSRSKRLELTLRALLLLDGYSLDVYGIEAEPDYVSEMKKLVQDLGLQSRVTFHGTVPMSALPQIYSEHRLLFNMASETIDKTMIEVMTCGCYPVTTVANAKAIGLQPAPSADTPEAIAAFVLQYSARLPLEADAMYEIAKKHSLEGLVCKMGGFMREKR